MSSEREPHIEAVVAGIAKREWNKTKPRELSRKEEIDHAVELIDRVSSIVKADKERAKKADKKFNKHGKVEMELANHKVGFFYEFFGRTETLVFGIEDEKVEIDLKHGKRGGLSDATIEYYPDLYEEDNVFTGLAGVQRANGLADRMDIILNGEKNTA
jgi:hypothetical protein